MELQVEALSAVTTLQELSRRALHFDPARPAIEYEKRWYDWGEMRHVADRLAEALRATGADARQPVAFVPRNRPSAVAAVLGLIAEGRTIQMIYAFQQPAVIAQNLLRLRPAIMVAGESEFSDEVKAVLRDEGIAGIVIGEMDAHPLAGFECSSARNPDAPLEPQIQILTSGTTGPPKQHPFPYELFAKHHALPGMLADPDKDWLAEVPYLLSFPLGNISGMYSTLPTMFKGQRGILVDRFTLAAWHDWVLRFRPVNGGLPPAGVQMILDADIPREDLSSVKVVATGAAPLDPTVQRAFEEKYGIPILLSYGATEFGGPVVSMTPELLAEWGKKKTGSVGRAMPGAKVRIVDPAREVELPPGQEGIVEVVSPRIGPDWIRTSDVAVIDEDGFMFLRGRADGAIMRGGFKLLPEPIERALLLHPAVSVAGVVGRKDHRLGEVPVAAIQLKPGAVAPSPAELESHIRQHVSSPHVPVDWMFVDDMPKNRSMKIDRPALRALLALQ